MNKQTVMDMYAYYQEDHSLAETGLKFNYAKYTVHHHFKRNGFPMRTPSEGRSIARRKTIAPAIIEMHAQYEQGVYIAELAREYGYTRATIYTRFKEFGLPIYPDGRGQNFKRKAANEIDFKEVSSI